MIETYRPINSEKTTSNQQVDLLAEISCLKKVADSKLIKQQHNEAIDEYLQIETRIEQSLVSKMANAFSDELCVVYVAVLSNLSQAYLNMCNLDAVITYSTKTLSIDPGHIKSYLRLAKAYTSGK
jgi:hypothetical protein